MYIILFQILFGVFFLSPCYSEKRAVNDCGIQQFLTAPTGVIKSHAGIDNGHHYGKNMYCTWHIEAPVGYYVELVAETFELYGSSGSCYNDYLTLYDGPYTNYTSLGAFCGTTFLPISSTGRYLTLLFRTNSYTQMNGFKLRYNFTQTIIHSCQNGQFLCANNYKCVPTSYKCDGDDDCGDDSDEEHCPPFTCSANQFLCGSHERKCISSGWLCDGGSDCQDGSDEVQKTCNSGAWKCGQLNNTGASGIIQSPGYPNRYYPTIMLCKYQIFAPNDTMNITITFESPFSIETDTTCAYDYIKIYTDGPSDVHGPYCGTRLPPTFTIDSDHVIVEFNSDKSDSYTGFRLTWTAS